jgi:hypothetical protein
MFSELFERVIVISDGVRAEGACLGSQVVALNDL